MKKLVFVAAVVAAVSALPAYAQDASNVGGAKIGAVVGYDKARVKLYDEFGSKDGILYGVTAGYDYDMGKVVIGIEGEISDSSTKDSIQSLVYAGDKFSLRSGRDLYVGARFGVPVSSTVLLYAKAGYTNARFTAKYDDTTSTSSSGDNLEGYRVGGGVEVSNDGGAFARFEYRYSDYGSYKYNGFDTGVK